MTQTKSPAVCICIPTYNSSPTIIETLNSICNQTYPELMIYVVDNASNDNTIELVQNYIKKDNRIRLFTFEENIGGEGNFTRCIQLASGEYTAIYHSDDIYTTKMVERQVNFLQAHSQAGAVFTGARNIDEKNKPGHIRRLPPEVLSCRNGIYDFKQVFKQVLEYGNFLVCPSAMVRTSIYKEEIKFWNGTKFATSADLDVWFRILQKHSIGIINEPLMLYRVSTNSFSFNYLRSSRGRHDMFQVLDDYIQNDVYSCIEKDDKINYELLILKDDIQIAMNLLLKGERKETRDQISRIFSSKYLFASVKTRYHFKILIIGYLAFFLALIPLGNKIRELLYKIRHGI